jgi:hypothetical protein
MSHLTPDELIDAVDGRLGARRLAHLADCERCHTRAGQLRAALGDARRVQAPDPSPLFWEHFSARVRAAIAEEAVPGRHWPFVWLRWPVVAPWAAMTVILIALGAAVSRAPVKSDAARPTSLQSQGDAAAVGEREWAVVSAILMAEDLEAANDAGMLVRPGDVEQVASELSAAEQEALIKLLKAEMDRSGG